MSVIPQFKKKIKAQEFLTKFFYVSLTPPSKTVLSSVANNVFLNGGCQHPNRSAHPFGIIIAPTIIWRLCTFGCSFNPQNSSVGFISISYTSIESSISRVAEPKYDKFQPLRTNLRKIPLTEPKGLEWLILVIMLNQPRFNTGCFLRCRFAPSSKDYAICFCFQHQ